MWTLRSDKGDQYDVIPGKVNLVGRTDCDLILTGDQSISRKHACLEDVQGKLVVYDPYSKYGTFYTSGSKEKKKLERDVKAVVDDGDRIQFGLQWNIWTVKSIPLLVCTSALSNRKEKNLLGKLLSSLGGTMCDEWTEDCTHLTMLNLTLTVKVVCALACAKPIVTPLFWQRYHEAFFKKQEQFPNLAEFVPPLNENFLKKDHLSFLPNTKRRTIFKNKIFVFPNAKMLQAQECMVKFAGGDACEMSSCKMKASDMCQPDVIVIQKENKSGSQSTLYNSVIDALHENGLRAVPGAEIGLAILKVSLTRLCNPSVNTHSSQSTASSFNSPSGNYITLAADTEDLTVALNATESQNKSDIVIPPTAPNSMLSMSVNNSVGMEQKRASDSMDAPPAKKRHLDLEDSQTTKKEKSSISRQDVDDFFFPPDPVKKAAKVELDEFSFPLIPSASTSKTATQNSVKTSAQGSKKKRTHRFDDEDDFDFSSEQINSAPKYQKINTQGTRNDKITNGRIRSTTGKLSNIASTVQAKQENSSVRKMSRETLTLKGFLCKSSAPLKKEETTVSENKLEEEFKNRMIIETIPVTLKVVGRIQSVDASPSSPSLSKNFKKFKKVWEKPSHRKVILADGLMANKASINDDFLASSYRNDDSGDDCDFGIPPSNRRSRKNMALSQEVWNF